VSLTSAYINSAQQGYSGYDIVILGAGCAGLSLVMRLLQDERTAHKKILLVDKEEKTQNDRTWCFWEAGSGFFENIVTKQWSNIEFYSNHYSSRLDIAPYTYKMIRGIDFYNHCLQKIKQHSNVSFLYDEVITFSGKAVQLKQSAIDCTNALVFSSLYKPPVQQKGRYYLLQHFKGWMVETTEPAFDAGRATLMDFRVSQQHGASFVYVMPLSATKALVEYTLFTGSLLQQDEYDAALENYLANYLHIKAYTVTETEFGVIPMASAPMPAMQDGAYLIGQAGGQTKASTGYTFQFIQKQAAAIAAHVAAGKIPSAGDYRPAARFRLYDNTLLHILAHKRIPGDEIFARLFKKNKAAAIFSFLDNETTFSAELKIMTTVPQWLFIKAAITEWLKGV
jgi:lycopene beta-cyclase